MELVTYPCPHTDRQTYFFLKAAVALASAGNLIKVWFGWHVGAMGHKWPPVGPLCLPRPPQSPLGLLPWGSQCPPNPKWKLWPMVGARARLTDYDSFNVENKVKIRGVWTKYQIFILGSFSHFTICWSFLCLHILLLFSSFWKHVGRAFCAFARRPDRHCLAQIRQRPTLGNLMN